MNGISICCASPKKHCPPAAPIIELGQFEKLNVRHLVAWEDKTGMGASRLLLRIQVAFSS
jgi:hypothetical protein